MKKVLKLFIAIIIMVVIIFAFFSYNNINMNNMENIQNTQIITHKNKNFYIDKIIAYSSANAKNNGNERHAYWDLSIYQYTDFAIYINKNEATEETDIQEIYIENLKIENMPEFGIPRFYIRNIMDIGKQEFSEDEIQDKIQFENDIKIPLTFGYINEKIKDGYIIKDIDKPLEFNGSILKRANISIDSIKSSLSFTVKIINSLGEIYKTDVTIKLPITEKLYEGEEKNILEENIHFDWLLEI